MRRYPLVILCAVASCSWNSPDLPPTDTVLQGTYAFASADNSNFAVLLEGAWLEFTEEGAVTFTNPGFTTVEYGVVDIVERGRYSVVEQADSEGFLMLDITFQSPPKQAGYYVFHGGLNRLRYSLVAGADEERLNIRIVPDGSTRSWAAFVRSTPPVVIGDYSFVRSTSHTLDDLLKGATLSFAADSTFDLENPVTVNLAHEDSLILVSERGTYSVSLDSIRFTVLTQEPAGAESLFLLQPPSVTGGVGFAGSLLALTFRTAVRTDSTLWTPPQTVGETEPNDTTTTATTLGGAGAYIVTGTVESGGVGLQGYTGDLDYFQAVTGFDGELSVELSWQDTADLDLFVFDGQGGELARSANPRQVPPESVTLAVSAGQELYVMVASFDNPASYTCSVTVP